MIDLAARQIMVDNIREKGKDLIDLVESDYTLMDYMYSAKEPIPLLYNMALCQLYDKVVGGNFWRDTEWAQ